MQPGNRSDSKNSMELIIRQERLRQARLSFNAALVMTVASIVVSLVGIALLLAGKTSLGAVTATGSLAVSVSCAKLAKDAIERLDKINERLGKILEELEDEEI